MKLSSRSCHAARILLELARQTGQEPLQASVLSARLAVSVKFIEKIIRPLKRAGLIEGVRGANGGYVLRRHPGEISLAGILEIMEGGVFRTACCEGPEDCSLVAGCGPGSVWSDLSLHLERELSAVTLADLLGERQAGCPLVGRLRDKGLRP